MVRKKEMDLLIKYDIFYEYIGVRVHSESLLCSAGRVWSSSKVLFFFFSKEVILENSYLGLENCAWPHEVTECTYIYLFIM